MHVGLQWVVEVLILLHVEAILPKVHPRKILGP